VSYILDALTKAAKQRDRQAPVLQRLLSPAPAPSSVGSRWSGRLLAAMLLNAILLTMLLVMWLWPGPVVAPPESLVGPLPEVPTQKTTPREREATTAPKPSQSQSSTISPTQPTTSPPGPRRPAAAAGRAQEPTVTPPVAAGRSPAPSQPAGLKLEALIYADVPASRMIFINGRKYVEGDSIDDRLRVEEIQEDGVVLNEQGRRFTLRAAR
jgi:hypothetical protein